MASPYGAAVESGAIRYFSVSSISTGDPGQYGGCGLRYWFKYVARCPEPQTASQKRGTEELHEPIEHYLRTGERAFPRMVLRGAHFIPDRGPDLLIEHEISGTPAMSEPLLTAAGVPLVGKIDCVNPRGIQYGVSEFAEAYATAPNTIEVLDWKSTGDFKWMKQPSELMETVQMPGYAEYMFRKFPSTEFVRLSHIYFHTSGNQNARRSSTLVDREQVARRWESVEVAARSLVQVAAEEKPPTDLGNLSACGAYKGCPHRLYCPRVRTGALETFFDQTTTTNTKASQHMSLLSQLQNAAPDPQTARELAAQKAALRAEEFKASRPDFKAFAAAAEIIRKGGIGFPTVTGEASTYLTALNGWDVPDGTKHQGEGRAAALELKTASDIIALAREIDPAFNPDTLVRSVPPIPAVARTPEDVARTVATAGTDAVRSAPPTLLPPDAPNPAAVPAANASAPAGGLLASMAGNAPTSAPAGDEAPKRRGRPPGSKNKNKTATAGAPTSGDDTLTVFVNAIPNVEFEDLSGWIADMCQTVCDKYKAVDVRCAPNDTPLQFGGWRGVIAALVRENPPPAGVYVLDTRGSEIADVVADALRTIATVYVRGIA